MRCSLHHVRISSSSRFSGACGGVEVFVGRQNVTLGRSSLCSDVNSMGGMVSMLVMWLNSFMMFTFAPGVSCWIGSVVMWSLARRLASVAVLRNVLTYLWTVLV